jgi:hypothetical protein
MREIHVRLSHQETVSKTKAPGNQGHFRASGKHRERYLELRSRRLQVRFLSRVLSKDSENSAISLEFSAFFGSSSFLVFCIAYVPMRAIERHGLREVGASIGASWESVPVANIV